MIRRERDEPPSPEEIRMNQLRRQVNILTNERVIPTGLDELEGRFSEIHRGLQEATELHNPDEFRNSIELIEELRMARTNTFFSLLKNAALFDGSVSPSIQFSLRQRLPKHMGQQAWENLSDFQRPDRDRTYPDDMYIMLEFPQGKEKPHVLPIPLLEVIKGCALLPKPEFDDVIVRKRMIDTFTTIGRKMHPDAAEHLFGRIKRMDGEIGKLSESEARGIAYTQRGREVGESLEIMNIKKIYLTALLFMLPKLHTGLRVYGQEVEGQAEYLLQVAPKLANLGKNRTKIILGQRTPDSVMNFFLEMKNQWDHRNW